MSYLLKISCGKILASSFRLDLSVAYASELHNENEIPNILSFFINHQTISGSFGLIWNVWINLVKTLLAGNRKNVGLYWLSTSGLCEGKRRNDPLRTGIDTQRQMIWNLFRLVIIQFKEHRISEPKILVCAYIQASPAGILTYDSHFL